MNHSNTCVSERIVATGLGPVHALGIGKDAFFRSLASGVDGAKPARSIDVSNFKHQYACEVGVLDLNQYSLGTLPKGCEKASLYAILGTQLAVDDAGLTREKLKNQPVGCFLGTTDGESQGIDALVSELHNAASVPQDCFDAVAHARISRNINLYLDSTGPAYTIGNACSASNAAIVSAVEYLQSTEADFAICGGSDVACRKTFAIFHRLSALSETRCTPFDIHRKGIIPAEGASILLLEKLSSALARKTKIYGEVVGYGMNCDTTHMTNLNPEKIKTCLNSCLDAAGLAPEEVNYICMHSTGTPANDLNEYQSVKKCLVMPFLYVAQLNL
ncbi:3-oxoacyl-[acyl-carrier-protein] synthase 2 [Sodalis praecaptivus]